MHQIDFSSDNIISNIFRTAVPLLIAQMFNLLYNIVDRIYIGRIPEIGTEALGAVGLCFPLIVIISGFTNLYGSGGAPLFSIELGRGNHEEALKIMRTAFMLILMTGTVLFIGGEVFAIPLLRLIGATNERTLSLGLPYFRIYLLGTLFQMTALGMNPYINAQGFPGIGMRTIVIGAVANTVLDPILIFGFGMGISGAAVATFLSQILSCLSAVRFLFGEKAPFRLGFLPLKDLNGRRILDIVGLGMSSFIMMATNSLVQIVCNSVLMMTGGPLYLSIMTIIASIRQVLDLPAMSLADGASPVMSYNYGAGKRANVRKSIFTVLFVNVVYTAVIWGLILLFPVFFIRLFSNDPSILKDAIPALHIYFFAFLFQSFQYSGQTAFKALGKKKRNIFFSLLRKVFIVIPLAYMLPLVFGLGPNGVFMAEPVSNVIGGSACFITMLLTIMPELSGRGKSRQQ